MIENINEAIDLVKESHDNNNKIKPNTTTYYYITNKLSKIGDITNIENALQLIKNFNCSTNKKNNIMQLDTKLHDMILYAHAINNNNNGGNKAEAITQEITTIIIDYYYKKQ